MHWPKSYNPYWRAIVLLMQSLGPRSELSLQSAPEMNRVRTFKENKGAVICANYSLTPKVLYISTCQLREHLFPYVCVRQGYTPEQLNC